MDADASVNELSVIDGDGNGVVNNTLLDGGDVVPPSVAVEYNKYFTLRVKPVNTPLTDALLLVMVAVIGLLGEVYIGEAYIVYVLGLSAGRENENANETSV